jgi:hypothetical protein
MPKLLDWLKDKNISHEDAMKFLEEKYKPELLTEDEKAAKAEKEKVDKPAAEVKEEIEKPKEEVPKEEKQENSKPEMATSIYEMQKEITKTITEEIKKQMALLRGSPPKGVVGEQPTDNRPTVTKNLFETRV